MIGSGHRGHRRGFDEVNDAAMSHEYVGVVERVRDAVRTMMPGERQASGQRGWAATSPTSGRPLLEADRLRSAASYPELIRLISERRINPGTVFDLRPSTSPNWNGDHFVTRRPGLSDIVWTNASPKRAPEHGLEPVKPCC